MQEFLLEAEYKFSRFKMSPKNYLTRTWRYTTNTSDSFNVNYYDNGEQLAQAMLMLYTLFSCVSNSMNWKSTDSLTYGHIANLRTCMVPYDPVWSCMVPYGPVWSHMVPWGPVWSHTVTYSPAGTHMVRYCPIWSCMVLHVPVWYCIVMYGPSWSLMAR